MPNLAGLIQRTVENTCHLFDYVITKVNERTPGRQRDTCALTHHALTKHFMGKSEEYGYLRVVGRGKISDVK